MIQYVITGKGKTKLNSLGDHCLKSGQKLEKQESFRDLTHNKNSKANSLQEFSEMNKIEKKVGKIFGKRSYSKRVAKLALPK